MSTRVHRRKPLAGLLVCLLGLGGRPAIGLAADVWPREFGADGRSVLVYEPEVESWSADGRLQLRAPVAVTAAGAPARYGVLDLVSPAEVDARAQSVLLAAPQASVRFQGLADGEAAPLQAIVRAALPEGRPLTLSLPALIAAGGTPPAAARTVAVDLAPPPIFHSTQPATLLTFFGSPDFQPLGNGRLQAAANTTASVLYDPDAQRYYLALADAWLVAPDLRAGPWTQPLELPAAFRDLPADTWAALTAHGPGQRLRQVPAIVYTEQPAELIVTDGAPRYVPVAGTRLQAVQNTASALFLQPEQRLHYFLDAGRWFSAPTLAGPWQAATDRLPPDFARIPPDGPYGWVLASVPGTPAAAQAVALASVPHKATVRRDRLRYTPVFDGEPRYQPIEGTGGVDWVVNTRAEVVRYQNRYYGVDDGVWFVSDAAGGPWQAAERVPEAIYRIPPAHPLYHDTYVRVYDTAPDTVTYGYTSGYAGQYVSNGVLMLGVGALAGWALADHGGHHRDGDHDGWRPWMHPDMPWQGYGADAVYQPGQGFVSRERHAEALAPLPVAWDEHHRAWQPPAVRPAAPAAVPTPFTGADPYRHWGGSEATHDARWQQARAFDAPHPAPVAAGQQAPIFVGKDGGLYRRTNGDDWQRVASDGRTEAIDRTQAGSLIGAAHRAAPAAALAADPRSAEVGPTGHESVPAAASVAAPQARAAAELPPPVTAPGRPAPGETAPGTHREPAATAPAAAAPSHVPANAGMAPGQPPAPASQAPHAAPGAEPSAVGSAGSPTHPAAALAPSAGPDLHAGHEAPTHPRPLHEAQPPASADTPHPAPATPRPSSAQSPMPPAPVHAAPPAVVHPATPESAPTPAASRASAPERPMPPPAHAVPPAVVHPATPEPAPAPTASRASAPERPMPPPAPHTAPPAAVHPANPQPAPVAPAHPHVPEHAPVAASAAHPAEHAAPQGKPHSTQEEDKAHHKPEG